MVCADADYPTLRARLLAWAAAFPQMAVLDSCQHADAHGRWRLLVAVRGDNHTLPAEAMTPGTWYFGGIGYSYRMDIEPHLPAPKPASIPFPATRFFAAETVLGIPHQGNQVVVLAGSMPVLPAPLPPPAAAPQLPLTDHMPAAAYHSRFATIREAIRTGEVYELNLCREMTTTLPGLDTVSLWQHMVTRSPVPMAAYMRLGGDFVLMCASPERFLLHHKGLLVTQPIKGTVRRQADTATDATLLQNLRQDPKVRAENLMIADLARNDLGRVCLPGTIATQTCQPLTLSTLHHLVSTVMGVLNPGLDPWEAVRAAFPPGSMTGAPKVRAMELIHEVEPYDRGLYSGCVGYVTPTQSFDFNVVIRSYVYAPLTGRLGAHVGGALTWDSQAAAEYAETETKALALRFA